MRLLVFSDIHNNLAAVRVLRRCETNDYDAIVVAGDIGSETTTEFFAIVDTFECPVFYVLGNWDNNQPYTGISSKNGVLLHQQMESHSGYFFTGFSGCPTHWGQNPVYAEAVAYVRDKYSATLETLANIQVEAARLAEPVDAEFKERGVRLLKRKAAVGNGAHRKAREQLRAWREGKLSRLRIPEEKFRESQDYQSYRNSIWECGRIALARNRQALISLIKYSSVPMNHLIVITHERLFKLSDDGITPLMHIFGHRHEYKFTRFSGTNYLNAAALDPSIFIMSEGVNQSPGGYCRVTLEDENVVVDRLILPRQKR